MELALYFLAAYGLLSLILTLWYEFTNRRSWIFVVLISDPAKVEGELRSFLADYPVYKTVPKKVVLIWKNQEYSLRKQLEKEFPGVEFREYMGGHTLEEIFHEQEQGKVVVFEC